MATPFLILILFLKKKSIKAINVYSASRLQINFALTTNRTVSSSDFTKSTAKNFNLVWSNISGKCSALKFHLAFLMPSGRPSLETFSGFEKGFKSCPERSSHFPEMLRKTASQHNQALATTK
ncbi:hypothetical protein EGT49_11405 [Companilactobacillus suantsaicola]|uniref:Uncharacterized protein n=1 Tax=Companilactobacillus suantsaicola TaxID=2487723 RepID=A0A4Z0JEZ7_9LACO|nr:hypothetical protein EGT49_11405 [Companilactobacillus suantsaicola]